MVKKALVSGSLHVYKQKMRGRKKILKDGEGVDKCVSHRCIMRYYVDNIDKLKPTIEQLKRITETPFGVLLNVGSMEVNTRLLDDLYGSYKGDNNFLVAGKLLNFSVNDVGGILGLPCNGFPIMLDKIDYKQSIIAKKYYSGDITKKGRREDILEIMKILKNSNETDDFVRFWIMFMFACFLAPHMAHDAPKALFCYVDRLDELKFYNWSHLIHEIIMSRAANICKEINERKTGKRKKVNTYAMGSQVCLLAWLYEHTKVIIPTFPTLLPRFRRWTHNNDYAKNFLRVITESQVIVDIQFDSSEMYSINADQVIPITDPIMKYVLKAKNREFVNENILSKSGKSLANDAGIRQDDDSSSNNEEIERLRKEKIALKLENSKLKKRYRELSLENLKLKKKNAEENREDEVTSELTVTPFATIPSQQTKIQGKYDIPTGNDFPIPSFNMDLNRSPKVDWMADRIEGSR